MQDYVEQIDINQYLPLIIDVGINVLLAAIILIVGLYIANKASSIINKIGERYDKLDNTLFRFLGSVAKYIILAFVAIAVLNRFGV